MTEGETHVPYTVETGKSTLAKREMMRENPPRLHPFVRKCTHALMHLFLALVRFKVCEIVDKKRGTSQFSNPFYAGKVFGMQLGTFLYGLQRVVSHLVFGWPAYRENCLPETNDS